MATTISSVELNGDRKLRRTIRYIKRFNLSRFRSGLKLNWVEIRGTELNKNIKDFAVIVNNRIVPTVIIDVAKQNETTLHIWFLAFKRDASPLEGEEVEKPDFVGVGAITVTIDTEDEPVSGEGEIDEIIEG